MSLDADLLSELSALNSRGLLRRTSTLMGPDRLHPVSLEGSSLLSFCSNDYLGLSGHRAVVQASAQASLAMSSSAGGSRLVSGESPIHLELERYLADFLGTPAALLFPTGYQANLGVLTALAGPRDLIVSDALNHASIIDGCRLSRAQIAVYPHCDLAAAAKALASSSSYRRRILVTESLFSMEGDRAPLAELAELVASNAGILVVDEAHALGIAGPGGRGLAAAASVTPDVTVGTLGKSFASLGGFVAGSEPLRAFLLNRARSFIYTTAPPPSVAAAALAAVQVATSEEGDALRTHAQALASRLRQGLKDLGAGSPPGCDSILSLPLGEERHALEASSTLLKAGILIPAIRPPTVPAGTSRLRITLSARHTEDEVDYLLGILTLLARTFDWGP